MYPFTRTVPVADVHHGVRVPDPYRWLEDGNSPEVQAWVTRQNLLTRLVLDTPERQAIRRRLAALHDHPRTGAPTRRGGRAFYLANTGLQEQDVLHVQDAPGAPPRVLLDPNTLSVDGTVSVPVIEVSEDGRAIAYATSESGSDWQTIRVRDVASAADRPDCLHWAKFVSLTWLQDGSGFYYTRFPQPGSVPPGEEHYASRICFHRLGDAQEADALVFVHPDDRQVVFMVDLVFDDRYLVITGCKGASDKGEVRLLDRHDARARPLLLFPGFTTAWSLVGWLDGRLVFRTDHEAPLGRLVQVTLPDSLRQTDTAHAHAPQIEGARLDVVLPERGDRLEDAVIAGGDIVVRYLRRASSVLLHLGGDGIVRGEIPLPALGSVTQLSAHRRDPELFFAFESFTWPPTPFRVDLSSGTVTPVAESSWAPGEAYGVEQVWVTSRDGTQVSMFVVSSTDAPRDGRRPTLLSGYGGFDISLTPTFDPSLLLWLERGGVYALANLRGGGEYGEAWHEAGTRERKQNVFDDFIAAAEWLVASGFASPRTLAIEGGSNGGLLVAAVMTQRPELVGAVVCRVPVADMLRYHLFTVGRFWIPEYGSADDAAQFAVLHAYSPYHRVRDGTAYPATLVMTADTDDRVDPGMARKFAARLQAATAGPAPVLLRVDIKAGHGAGKPVSKVLDEDADIYTFLVQNIVGSWL